MAQRTAYLLARINVTHRRLEGVSIFSEENPTAFSKRGGVCVWATIDQATADTFENAVKKLTQNVPSVLGDTWDPGTLGLLQHPDKKRRLSNEGLKQTLEAARYELSERVVESFRYATPKKTRAQRLRDTILRSMKTQMCNIVALFEDLEQDNAT